MSETKEIYFVDYCKTCKHKYLKESEDPCDRCLEKPYMYDSHKPMFWEKNESIKSTKAKN